MRKKTVFILLSSMMVLVFFTHFSLGVIAAENQNGGQVVTEGIITFYEESTEPTTEPSSSEPISTSTPPNTSKFPDTKSAGKIPSLGDIAKGSISIIGIILIIAVFFFIFWKRRNDKGADE